jgi:hypothetical protein
MAEETRVVELGSETTEQDQENGPIFALELTEITVSSVSKQGCMF